MLFVSSPALLGVLFDWAISPGLKESGAVQSFAYLSGPDTSLSLVKICGVLSYKATPYQEA